MDNKRLKLKLKVYIIIYLSYSRLFQLCFPATISLGATVQYEQYVGSGKELGLDHPNHGLIHPAGVYHEEVFRDNWALYPLFVLAVSMFIIIKAYPIEM
jgi:hypothetical protein